MNSRPMRRSETCLSGMSSGLGSAGCDRRPSPPCPWAKGRLLKAPERREESVRSPARSYRRPVRSSGPGGVPTDRHGPASGADYARTLCETATLGRAVTRAKLADGLGLSHAETRVLGCLLEKQRTTPDAYPLSLNALRAACN